MIILAIDKIEKSHSSRKETLEDSFLLMDLFRYRCGCCSGRHDFLLNRNSRSSCSFLHQDCRPLFNQSLLDDLHRLTDLFSDDRLPDYFLCDYGSRVLMDNLTTLSLFMQKLLVRFMNHRFVHLMNYILVALMNNRLVNLPDLLPINDRLVMFMNHRLVMLVDDILVVLVQNVLVVLMNNIPMRFLNYRSVSLCDYPRSHRM